jgi:hypothetical protein
MALPTSSSTPQWRVLSDAELAATPDAKLGGPLAIIVGTAAAIAAIKGLMYALYLMVVGGAHGGGGATILRMFAPLDGTRSAWIQNLNLAVPALMFIWGSVVTAMSLVRARATPSAASALIAAWLVVAMTVTVLKRMVTATDGLNLIDYLQMAPNILFNVMIAAAFCGYMLEGRRPNLFYRRRIRIQSPATSERETRA